jgi:hypothetical protein
MAGDWIKMRACLAYDPAVIGIAATLDITEFEVVGILHNLWSWADSQSRDGHAVGVTEKWINSFCQRDGFASAMQKAGWLEINDAGVSFPNFDRHNGETAKARGLAAIRKQKQRANVTQEEGQVSRTERDECVTREEKRREEKDQEHKAPASPAPGVEKTAIKKSAKFDPLTSRPANVGIEAWADFCAHRQKKSALTAKACELIANKLATHHDPDAVLYRSIENGWTGIFPEQVTHEASPSTRGAGRLSAVDAVKHAIAARTAAEAQPGLAGQAVAEDGGTVRPALDGEFRRVG